MTQLNDRHVRLNRGKNVVEPIGAYRCIVEQYYTSAGIILTDNTGQYVFVVCSQNHCLR